MSASTRPTSSTATPPPAARLQGLPYLRTVLAAMLLAMLSGGALWLSLATPRPFTLDVGKGGSGDRIFLREFYHPEINTPSDAPARTYRWARGDAAILLPVGRHAPAILTAVMSAPPQPADAPLDFAMYAGDSLIRFAVPHGMRTYQILLPDSAVERGLIRLRFASPTVTIAGDDRHLAVALDWIGVQPLPILAPPALPFILAQVGLTMLVAALLWINGARLSLTLAGTLGAVALLSVLNQVASAWTGLGIWPLLLVGVALTAASLVAQRCLPRSDTAEARFARRLWVISLAGLALRLIGVSAPGFAFNDLDIQSIFLGNVIGGEILLFVSSHEFGGGRTFYPPGPYLLGLPLLLVRPTLPFALHIGAALLDACGPPLLALVARELRMERRAALFAAATLAALPVHLTALWWGFFTNIGGQMLTLLLLWLLLRYTRMPNRRGAAWLFLTLCLVFLSHVGVLILTATTALLTLSLAWLRPRPTTQAWRGLLIAGIGAGVVCTLIYLSAAAPTMLTSAHRMLSDRHFLAPERLAEHRAYLQHILPVALWRGMGMLPFLSLLPGIPLILAHAERPLGRAVVLGWLTTPFLFAVVDYVNTFQVRYIYFLAPLCALAFAAVLDRLWMRPAGRRAALAALVLIFWLGGWLWFRGAILGIKMSLVPLTH